MRVNKKTKKALSILMCFCMLISYVPVSALAEETDNLCDHHTTHTADCGYVATVAEVLCACTETDECGNLLHTEGCGYIAMVEGSECNYECAECEVSAEADTLSISVLTSESEDTSTCAHENRIQTFVNSFWHSDTCVDCGHYFDINEDHSFDENNFCSCGYVQNPTVSIADGNVVLSSELTQAYIDRVSYYKLGDAEKIAYYGTITITGSTTSNVISLEGGATIFCEYDVVLSDVTINVAGSPFSIAADVKGNITLKGDNYLISNSNGPGIHVPDGASLCIIGDNECSLNATGGEKCAGIGGSNSYGENCGTIDILGGRITAIGGNYGAGIGGGDWGAGGTVTIGGGTVIAQGGKRAAGIGGGFADSGGIVNIYGGSITATGGDYGAGIGGGSGGDSGKIVISSGTVIAKGGQEAAGIGGGGDGGSSGIVEIYGGRITATGGNYGAGIGGGDGGGCGTVYIDSGSITATGGDYGAGIGGGNGGAGGTVIFQGGNVLASGGLNAENIGCGHGGSDSGTLKDYLGQDISQAIIALFGAEDGTRITSLVLEWDYYYSTNDMFTIGDKVYAYLPSESPPLYINGKVLTKLEDGTYTTCVHSNKYCINVDDTYHKYVCLDCGDEWPDELHIGGIATCQAAKCCTVCGNEYGGVKANNHVKDTYTNGFRDCCGEYQTAVLNASGVYEICNAGQLYWFAEQVNAGQGDINGQLMADIFLNDNLYDDNGNLRDDLRVWTPIGNGDAVYYGVFDGQNFVVSGLYINNEAEWSGLFGYSAAEVKNVSLVSCYICGGRQTGGIAGFHSGHMSNCSVYGSITGGDMVGGIAGRNTNHVSGCAFYGSVSGDDHVGGIVGLNNGSLEECWNSYGLVSGTYYVGGITGQSFGSVKNCYNLSEVSGSSQTAGVVGTSNGTVTGCYSTGAVSGANSNTGGIVGFLYGGSVTNCYFNSEVFSGRAVGYNYGTVDSRSSGRTGAQFESGEVCWLLNSGVTNGSQVYYQTCGVSYPCFTGQTVYQSCDSESGYSNTEGSGVHNYDEPEFVWSEDGESCSAIFTCQTNTAHTETVGCTVVADTSDSNKVVYTATVTMNGIEYADTMEIERSLSDSPSEILRNYRKNTVTSADREIILKAISRMEELLAGDSLSEGNRELLEILLPLAEGLILRIDEADAADETENILKARNITAENVQPGDKTVLTAAKTDLEKALETYPGNYTAEEKAAIEEEISRIDAVLKALEKTENDEASGDKEDKVPPTGDGSRPVLWMILLITGIYALALTVRKRKTATGE